EPPEAAAGDGGDDGREAVPKAAEENKSKRKRRKNKKKRRRDIAAGAPAGSSASAARSYAEAPTTAAANSPPALTNDASDESVRVQKRDDERAGRQGGDPLTQLKTSPWQHSSTVKKPQTAEALMTVGAPSKTSPSPSPLQAHDNHSLAVDELNKGARSLEPKDNALEEDVGIAAFGPTDSINAEDVPQKSVKQQQLSLSQSLLISPLRSPSPLSMSQSEPWPQFRRENIEEGSKVVCADDSKAHEGQMKAYDVHESEQTNTPSNLKVVEDVEHLADDENPLKDNTQVHSAESIGDGDRSKAMEECGKGGGSLEDQNGEVNASFGPRVMPDKSQHASTLVCSSSDIVTEKSKQAQQPSLSQSLVKSPLQLDDDENLDKDCTQFLTAEPIGDIGIKDEHQRRKDRLLHQMEIKKEAMYRSMLHLSDRSYSIVYKAQGDQKDDAGNDDEEPGLPFIGPGLKEQYTDLRLLLQHGLLGCTDEDEFINKRADGENGSSGKNPYGNGEKSSEQNGEDPNIKGSVSALLIGPRGCGKTLVFERCLASLSRLVERRKEHILQRAAQQDDVSGNFNAAVPSFRVVRLNGILHNGADPVACVREIVRQISVMSKEERKRTKKATKRTSKRKRPKNSTHLETPERSKIHQKKEGIEDESDQKKLTSLIPQIEQNQTPDNPTNKIDSHDLRLRQSGFKSHILLLDEVLRTARIDGIPILFVLEELHTFFAEMPAPNKSNPSETLTVGPKQEDVANKRQLLLYHLLDRVADHNYLVSFVGMTTDVTCVTKLEKRVKSRVEGTSKIIYFDNIHCYDVLVQSLLGKFYTPPCSNECDAKAKDEYNEQKAMISIRKEVESILRDGRTDMNQDSLEEDNETVDDFELVRNVLQLNLDEGKDMRWFCKVLDVALGLLAFDIDSLDVDSLIHQSMEKPMDCSLTDVGLIPELSPSHMAQALVTMMASMGDVLGTLGQPGPPTQHALELIRWGQLVQDPKHYSCLVGTHPLLVALLDVSGPQIALLLSARRISARDDTRASAEDDVESIRRKKLTGEATANLSVPLTYQRIQDEYATSFLASDRYTTGPDRYPPHVLRRSCMDLMETEIIRLRREKVVDGGAQQFGHNEAISLGLDFSHLPLHVNLDWELEFIPVLKAGLLQSCTTALREWGLKMN
ncbi:hypothetical protein ACHAWF_015949, partial [Thalassiosira exigua]